MQGAEFSDSLAQSVGALRSAVWMLGGVSLVLAVGALSFLLRDPVVIERSEEKTSALLNGDSGERSAAEVQNFARLVIVMAEDPSKDLIQSYFSSEVLPVIYTQRKQLAKDGVRQSLLIHSVRINASKAVVEADRILAKENLRAAMAEVYEIDLREVPRSQSNPYGIEVVGIKSKQQEVKNIEAKN